MLHSTKTTIHCIQSTPNIRGWFYTMFCNAMKIWHWIRNEKCPLTVRTVRLASTTTRTKRYRNRSWCFSRRTSIWATVAGAPKIRAICCCMHWMCVCRACERRIWKSIATSSPSIWNKLRTACTDIRLNVPAWNTSRSMTRKTSNWNGTMRFSCSIFIDPMHCPNMIRTSEWNVDRAWRIQLYSSSWFLIFDDL